MTAVLARDLHAGDVLQEHDWTLDVTSAVEGDWTDRTGPHHGEIVITRQLGPLYPRHFALDQMVEVNR